VIGLPFPNVKDLKVTLKMEHNTQKSKTNPSFISGDAWLQVQAFRAVNQAIGRCIRHKDDFGAILLMDERFADQSKASYYPKWIRSRLTTYRNVSVATQDLGSFFATNAKS